MERLRFTETFPLIYRNYGLSVISWFIFGHGVVIYFIIMQMLLKERSKMSPCFLSHKTIINILIQPV